MARFVLFWTRNLNFENFITDQSGRQKSNVIDTFNGDFDAQQGDFANR